MKTLEEITFAHHLLEISAKHGAEGTDWSRYLLGFPLASGVPPSSGRRLADALAHPFCLLHTQVPCWQVK